MCAVEFCLAEHRPEIAKDWHPTKNGSLTPRDVRISDEIVPVTWRCQEHPDQEWVSTTWQRVYRVTMCPVCRLARRLAPGRVTVLSETHPEVAAQWHPTKNGWLTPDQVGTRSDEKVWWQCPVNPKHEWRAIVGNRTGRNAGCPQCARRGGRPRRPAEGQDLATLHPELAAMWHPTKNGNVTPSDVGANSAFKAWWRCADGHEFRRKVKRQVAAAYPCKECGGAPAMWKGRRASGLSRPLLGEDLTSKMPGLAAQWHPTKNGEVTPADVSLGSEFRATWQCPNDPSHVWDTMVFQRAHYASRCPVCVAERRGEQGEVGPLLVVTHPHLVAQWHPLLNQPVRIETVRTESMDSAWWRCTTDPAHAFECEPYRMTLGHACPTCAVENPPIPPTSLAATHPEVAALWHPTKNRKATPRQVTADDRRRRAWWRCPDHPEHEWRDYIERLVRWGGTCPRCHPRLATHEPSAERALSAVNPAVAAEWHPTRNAGLGADDVFAGSAQRAWWQCSENPAHEWEAEIYARARLGTGCPHCARNRQRGPRVPRPGEALLDRNPELVQYWHPTKNGPLTPADVTAGSRHKVWWVCAGDANHSFTQSIRDFVVARRKNPARPCPTCYRTPKEGAA